MSDEEPENLRILQQAIGRKGRIFVVSGPSGVGKGTVIRKVLGRLESLAISVSATTREPRPGEIDGVSYHFLTRDEFKRRRAAGELYESAEYDGNLYGTLRETVDTKRAEGIDLVLEIDIQGARSVRSLDPSAVLIYMLPPTMAELERRLVTRVTADYRKKHNLAIDAVLTEPQLCEVSSKVRKRLSIAVQELDCVLAAYDRNYIITNDTLDECAVELDAIVTAERQRLLLAHSAVRPT